MEAGQGQGAEKTINWLYRKAQHLHRLEHLCPREMICLNCRAHVNLAFSRLEIPGTEAEAKLDPTRECGHCFQERGAPGFHFHFAWESLGDFGQSWPLPGPLFSHPDFGYSHAHLACPPPQPLRFSDGHMGSWLCKSFVFVWVFFNVLFISETDRA